MISDIDDILIEACIEFALDYLKRVRVFNYIEIANLFKIDQSIFSQQYKSKSISKKQFLFNIQ